MDYNGANILAPMVRVGTLPMRLLAAEYGAHIVYTDELVDKRLMGCVRSLNGQAGTVDFTDAKGVVLLRTLPGEARRTVAQIGTSAPELALAAASVVAGDVGAIDVNMGCPLPFSVSGGMGSALLGKPETAADILSTLRRNLHTGLSCKIRLLATPASTVEFARRMEACGVDAVAVHGRHVAERSHKHAAHWDAISAVVAALGIPVIANGDVLAPADFGRIRAATGAAGVMAARGAQWNPSIFRPDGLLPGRTVRAAYVRCALAAANGVGNTKFCLREMLIKDCGLEGAEGRAVNAAKTMAQVAHIYGCPLPSWMRETAGDEGGEEEASDGAAASSGGGIDRA